MSTDFFGERGQAIGKAASSYEEITRRMLTRPILDDIGYYIDRGIKPDLFIKAFGVTADKGLGWAYTRGILQNCLEDGIKTAYDWDWRVKYKKGLADIKHQYGELEESTLCMVLMVIVFKEAVREMQDDFERYCAALENGDVSEWAERWCEFQFI